MCQRCISVYDKLKPMLEQLAKEMPGVAEDGAWLPAGHHVAVALQIAAREWLAREAEEAAMHDALTRGNIKDVV